MTDTDQLIEDMLTGFCKAARTFRELALTEAEYNREIESIIGSGSEHAGCSPSCRDIQRTLFRLAWLRVTKESEVKALATAKGAA